MYIYMVLVLSKVCLENITKTKEDGYKNTSTQNRGCCARENQQRSSIKEMGIYTGMVKQLHYVQ